MTKKKENKPTVEANDPSPILTPHLEDQPEQDQQEPVKEKPVPKSFSVDKLFDEAIKKVLSLQSDPSWKELISETPCFARLWYDGELGEYCDLIDCDLRNLCQSTWERIEGGLQEGEEPPRVRWKPEKGPKRGRPRKGTQVVKQGKWKGTGKYERHPYHDTGRPVDQFASAIYSFLNEPPLLPDGWKYPVSKTNEQQQEAIMAFMAEFGPGAWVTKRSSYHQYLFMGQHLMRLWVNAGGGGWLDLSRGLARIISKMGNLDLVKSPVSGYKTKFRFYPFRVYVGKDRDVELIKAALAKIENLVG